MAGLQYGASVWDAFSWFVSVSGHKADTSINPTDSLDYHTQSFSVVRGE